MNPDICRRSVVDPLERDDFQAWQEQSREIESREIVFIVGPQRTGTTWLVTALDKHPEVVAKHEGHIVSELVERLFGNIERYNGLPPYGFDHLKIREQDAINVARQLIDRQLLTYLRTAPAATPVRAIVDKSPNHCRNVGFLAALYPWAKFILCLRDVRDAAASMWFVDRDLGLERHATMEDMGTWYAKSVFGEGVRAARKAGRALGPGRYMEMWYESHLADPHAELRRVAEFIGVDASDQVIASIAEKSTFKAITGRDAGVEGKGVFRKGVVGDWRNYFSEDFGDRLLELAGIPELAERKSAPSGS